MIHSQASQNGAFKNSVPILSEKSATSLAGGQTKAGQTKAGQTKAGQTKATRTTRI